MRHALVALLLALLFVSSAVANNPATTIADSQQVITELVAIPGRQIPERLLSEAQGVAIVPRVIKIGFVAGVRRGNGVVLVRGADGSWGLPRFIRLTGGSVGWQAGVQGTDVVLVFRTRRSIDNLLKGKFTVGVDAAAAAGPVGRNASAATDTSLQAEILSYSRSRGLFLGASVDGSVIEIDQAANMAFYGSNDPESPQTVPASAIQLQSLVSELSGGQRVSSVEPASATGVPAVGNVNQAVAISQIRMDALRQSLITSSGQLSLILNPEWDKYLALPASIQDPNDAPNLSALVELDSRFELVGNDAQFKVLTERSEFQSTRELLREYIDATRTSMPTLVLPAPPSQAAVR